MAEKQSILGRIAQLTRANINALLDRAEDPEKMLNQLVRDYTASIAEARDAVAQTIGNLPLAEKDHDADVAEAELAEVRAMRPRFAELWELAEDDVAERVNALLAEAQALPQLVRHDGWDWHLHATTPAAPLATRMAVELGMALVDVVRAGELSRLQVCAADDCSAVLVDLSKNRSRRYCDGGCGNRVNVQAYRARQARHD